MLCIIFVIGFSIFIVLDIKKYVLRWMNYFCYWDCCFYASCFSRIRVTAAYFCSFIITSLPFDTRAPSYNLLFSCGAFTFIKIGACGGCLLRLFLHYFDSVWVFFLVGFFIRFGFKDIWFIIFREESRMIAWVFYLIDRFPRVECAISLSDSL